MVDKVEKRKPEGVTSGFPKVSANSRKQNQIVSLFYYIFRLFARLDVKKF
jgi:hypothetical protein